jgi:hypothetical protein
METVVLDTIMQGCTEVMAGVGEVQALLASPEWQDRETFGNAGSVRIYYAHPEESPYAGQVGRVLSDYYLQRAIAEGVKVFRIVDMRGQAMAPPIARR